MRKKKEKKSTLSLLKAKNNIKMIVYIQNRQIKFRKLAQFEIERIIITNQL